MEETRVVEMLGKPLLTSHASVWPLEMKILHTMISQMNIHAYQRKAKIILCIYVITVNLYVTYHERDQHQSVLS